MIPANQDQVDDAWLTAALRRGGQIADDDRANILLKAPLGEHSAFGGELFRMQYATTSGLTVSAVVKMPFPPGPTRDVHDVIGSYGRELAFYRHVAHGSSSAPVRTPRPIVTESDPNSSDTILIIEDLAPLVAADQRTGLSLANAASVVRGLAALHAWGWNNPVLDGLAETLPRMDSDRALMVWSTFGEVCRIAWPAIGSRLADDIPAAVARTCERFAELIPFFVAELSHPRTIIHGELRSDNLFIGDDGVPIFIDFQMAGQACGVFDVAYVVSQSMRTDVRRGHDEELVRAWWEGLRERGVTDYSWDTAWRQYRIATVWGLVYPMLVSTRWDVATAEGRDLLDGMMLRGAACVDDLGAVGLLPSG